MAPNFHEISTHLSRGGQLATRGPHVARHSVFNDPQKHSGKIFKSEISSNCHSTANVSAEANLNRDFLH